ncbi:hypothetical protein H257_04157 [Aphanomyces astaci]|uniref:Tc3 transposase DNA binding domain-containing protein n=1 Tax=Aphanomyces astaci TaxID=112090 RepID=W4GUL8_APHAT|nr:hypothetical protein H257_04157 [Aphanomyces astaci]ETV83430.1 hypothetical protein H257_04157 [Aphanomyces astaci]|eukprot:XP_009826860.1 hypothetical protein H257_04157 [Aphanomyces astaci]
MPRGEQFTEEERGMMLALRSHDMSYPATSRELGRSQSAVYNFLKDPTSYGKRYKPMKCDKVVGAEARQLFRYASTTGLSARACKTDLQLDASLRTIQRRLNENERFEYAKRLHTPCLTQAHKSYRMEYAERHLAANTDWDPIIWSDEKKFNLMSVMVWGAFSLAGRSELAFLSGKQNALAYLNTLQNYLFPFAHEHYGPCKMALRSTKMSPFFDHPVYSPDLNPIENLWGRMAQVVYANGRQFRDVGSLVAAIQSTWDDIPQPLLTSLVKSMPKRCVDVLKAKASTLETECPARVARVVGVSSPVTLSTTVSCVLVGQRGVAVGVEQGCQPSAHLLQPLPTGFGRSWTACPIPVNCSVPRIIDQLTRTQATTTTTTATPEPSSTSVAPATTSKLTITLTPDTTAPASAMCSAMMGCWVNDQT